MLVERRIAAVDRRYEVGYGKLSPQLDDVDSGRLRTGQEPPAGVWDDLDW
jgi:hypothetical protein